MQRVLAENVTLRDVLTTLDNPDDFVRQVYGTMLATSKESGEVVMRLGVRGGGKRPNYRLDDAATSETIWAIDGNNHKPWTGHEDVTSPANWSTTPMTMDEIKHLLGEIRGFKRKR